MVRLVSLAGKKSVKFPNFGLKIGDIVSIGTTEFVTAAILP